MKMDQREQFKILMANVSHPLAIEKWPKGAPMPDQYKIWHSQMIGCQLFEIDAENQRERDESEVQDSVPFLSTHREFNPPHDNMAFFLNKGGMTLPLHQIDDIYEEVEIVGFVVRKVQPPTAHKALTLLSPEKSFPQGDWYDCYIYSIATLREGQNKGEEGMNTQDCVFVFEKGEKESYIHIPEHTGMCRDKDCTINLFGRGTDKHLCNEVNARRAFVYMVLDVMAEFNKPREVIHKATNTLRTGQNQSLPPTPETNTTPKELLVSLKDIVIDRPRIVYDKIIGHGKGGKHKIRYDVRRHIRIVKDKIVWVSSYQRGDGEYIPRWHVKSKKIEITRYQKLIEKVSTHSAIEPLLVRVIKYLRGRK
jgi:hypothetical protein